MSWDRIKKERIQKDPQEEGDNPEPKKDGQGKGICTSVHKNRKPTKAFRDGKKPKKRVQKDPLNIAREKAICTLELVNIKKAIVNRS